MTTVDVLAIGAHPDDVEIGIGGTVRKLVLQGRRVGILDLSQGELASRGSVEERRAEAQRAAEILGVLRRQNAGLPDGGITNTTAQQHALIPFIRSFRPRVILAPMRDDRHPDHEAAHHLVRAADYFAGLVRLHSANQDSANQDSGNQNSGPESEPWRAPHMYFYAVHKEMAIPQLIVDVSGQFEDKLAALRAFRSQFHNPEYGGVETYVSSAGFWESIQQRAAYWGSRIGVAYGETLFSDGPIAVSTLPGIEEAS